MELVKYSKSSAFQRIKAWFLDENSIELSEQDTEKKDRLLLVQALRKNNKCSPGQTIKKLIDTGVSQATAYRDYNLSMELFGNIDQANIDAERAVLVENYWFLYQKAINKGEIETARKCLDSYKSLFNFGDTTQKLDPKKLEASEFHLKFPRGAMKLLTKMAENAGFNFMEIDAEDVKFEEIDENETVNEEGDE